MSLIKHHAMKMYKWIPYVLLILALDEAEWSDSCTDNFIPTEIFPDMNGMGPWVDPAAGLDAMKKEKNLYFFLSSDRNQTPAIQSTACSNTNWAIQTHQTMRNENKISKQFLQK
jgi:hypothetical protein